MARKGISCNVRVSLFIQFKILKVVLALKCEHSFSLQLEEEHIQNLETLTQSHQTQLDRLTAQIKAQAEELNFLKSNIQCTD